MNILFWVNSSGGKGSGHITRSATLAHGLQGKGYSTVLLTDKVTTNLKDAYLKVLLSESYEEALTKIKRYSESHKINWLVIDDYQIDSLLESKVKPYVEKILVIDDLANRSHLSDILIDQNITRINQRKYRNLVPPECKTLFGPAYLLARSNFYSTQNEFARGTLIFLGGGNHTEAAIKLTQLVREIKINEEIYLLITENYEVDYIKKQLKGSDVHVLVDVNDPSELFKGLQKAIVRCGFVSYELALLGVPAINLHESKIQKYVSAELVESGYGLALAFPQVFDKKVLSSTLDSLVAIKPTPLSNTYTPGYEKIITSMEALNG